MVVYAYKAYTFGGGQMELRVLRYFLAAVREQGISKAADVMHVTQPTLSRQIMDLEAELGTNLFERNNHTKRLTLTTAGLRFYEYACEIVELSDKAKLEISTKDKNLEGDVYIGAGESPVISGIAKIIVGLKNEHPKFRYHFLSGDSFLLLEKLDRGLIDFAVVVDAVNVEKYNSLLLPWADKNGILMRKDNPLAEKTLLTQEDLKGVSVLVSQQMMGEFKGRTIPFNIAGSYNLLYNASLLVKEGFACALCIDGIADTSEESPLVFRPVKDAPETRWNLVWRKGSQLSKAAEIFLEEVRKTV